MPSLRLETLATKTIDLKRGPLVLLVVSSSRVMPSFSFAVVKYRHRNTTKQKTVPIFLRRINRKLRKMNRPGTGLDYRLCSHA